MLFISNRTMIDSIISFLTNEDTLRKMIWIGSLLAIWAIWRAIKRFFVSFAWEKSWLNQNIVASIWMLILFITLCLLEYWRWYPEWFFQSFAFALFWVWWTLLFIFNGIWYYLGHKINHFVISFMMLLLIIMLSIDWGQVYGIQYLLFFPITFLAIIVSLRNRKN